MGKFIDLTGQTFGRLTVIKRVENSKSGRTRWLCKCECGHETIVSGKYLRNGDTKSCGCLHKEAISKGYGESAFNLVLHRYKTNAKKEGREFSVSEDDFRELVLCNCSYCGRLPYKEVKNKYNNGNFKYNGIDRIDNTKGYVKGNVRPCCWQCNNIKNRYGVNDFLLSHVKTIYENLDLGEISES